MKYVFFESPESQWGGFTLKQGVNLLDDTRGARALEAKVVRDATPEEIAAAEEKWKQERANALRLESLAKGERL